MTYLMHIDLEKVLGGPWRIPYLLFFPKKMCDECHHNFPVHKFLAESNCVFDTCSIPYGNEIIGSKFDAQLVATQAMGTPSYHPIPWISIMVLPPILPMVMAG